MHELAAMKDDDQVRERFLQSYRLMLDFYGMQLVDPQTGELARKPGSWQERYDNLRDSSHNNLRISRILKALGEMRFDAYPAAFVLFVLAEQSQHQHLNNRAIRSSMDAWVRFLQLAPRGAALRAEETDQGLECSGSIVTGTKQKERFVGWLAAWVLNMSRSAVC